MFENVTFPCPTTGVLSPLATKIWDGGDKILKSSMRLRSLDMWSMASKSMTQQSCTLLTVRANVKVFKILGVSSAKTLLLVTRNHEKSPRNVKDFLVSFLFCFVWRYVANSFTRVTGLEVKSDNPSIVVLDVAILAL